MPTSRNPTTSAAEAQDASSGTSRADDAQLGAQVWELTLRTVTGLLRAFEEDMKGDDFSLSWYDVLIQLAYAPEQRLRMQDLADAVVLTRSGLTRLVDRMERAGLVQRQPVPGDRRGSYAALTEKGRTTCDRLAAEHHRKIEEHFTGRLTNADLRSLRRTMLKLGVIAAEPTATDRS